MLYRAVLSSNDHAPGHFSGNYFGEFHCFIELDEDAPEDPSWVLMTRFAAHFGVSPGSVDLYNLCREDELVEQALGCATDLGWRWFECGVAAGRQTYVAPARTLFLVDDARTLEMLAESLATLQLREAAVYAQLGREQQFEEERAALPLPLVYRTHVHLHALGRRCHQVRSPVIGRLRKRAHLLQDLRQAEHLRALLPPEPLRGFSTRARWARTVWLQERGRAIFSALFGLAISSKGESA